MTVFTARRRAEEFNSLVEQDSTGTPPPAALAEFVALADQLRAVPAPEPRPEFTAALREELLAAADTLLAPSADAGRLALPARNRTRDRRLAVAVGGLAVVGATSSLAVAAQSALPGDMLYPIKRAMESAETGIRTSDDGRASALLSNATDRLEEATALSRAGDLGDGPYVAATLVDFADQSTEGSELLLDDYAENGDRASVEALRNFTAASMDTLTQLERQLPAEARDELRHAAQVLAEIDAAAERACPACRGGIDRLPAILVSGELADPTGLVPSRLLPGQTTPEQEQPAKEGRQRDGRQGDQSDPTGPLPDLGTVTSAPDPGGSGGTEGGTTGPLEDLTDALTGQGGEPTSNGGQTEAPDVGETLGDTVDDVVEDVDEILPGLP